MARAHAFSATLLLGLAACGGRARGSLGSGSGTDAGADAGAEAGAGTRVCAFRGFATLQSYGPAREPFELTVIDSAGAGHLDLMVGERSDNLSQNRCELFANAGDGTFASQPAFGASGNACSGSISADFDGDGKVDLASQTTAADGSGVLGIDFSTGQHTFALALTQYPMPRANGDLLAGDFDGDGHPDIVSAGFDIVESHGGLPVPEPGNPALAVLLNTGSGKLAAPVLYASPHLLAEPATGDFNGDGQLDVVALADTNVGGFDVYLNAGGGTFEDPQRVIASATWSADGIAVADFNGDGKSDVATTTILDSNEPDEQTVLQIFSGRSDGNFDGPASYGIVALPAAYRVLSGDFNGDGKPDIAMLIGGNQSPGAPALVAVFLNRGDGSFGPSSSYSVAGTAQSVATAVAVGDFNGDGVTDIALTTQRDEAPYAAALSVLLSECR